MAGSRTRLHCHDLADRLPLRVGPTGYEMAIRSDRAAYYKDFISVQLYVIVNLAPIFKQEGRYACPNCSSTSVLIGADTTVKARFLIKVSYSSFGEQFGHA